MPARVALQLLDESHMPFLAELIQDPGVRRFTRVPEPPAPGWERTWFDRYVAGRADGTREAFAIVEGAGEPIGVALAVGIDREAETVELGYVVAPAAQGRGVATAALRLLTAWASEELQPQRIELLIGVENPASSRVAERCGYTLEGVLRNTYLKAGAPRDATQVWSRVPSDPPLDPA